MFSTEVGDWRAVSTFTTTHFRRETFEKKDIGLVDRRAGESVSHAIAWLKKTPRRPFFLWLHLYDPHSPYDPPEPYRTEYRTHLYDGEIAYADHELGRLIAWLKQNRLYDSSLIVVLSDHGESLGEHGEDEHGFFVYNSTVHVPLIVKPPVRSPAGGGIAAGRRAEPVETTAVAPTLLQLAGLKNSADSIYAQFQSRALLDTNFAESTKNEAMTPAAKDSAYSETFYPFSSFGWSPLHALESERFHFIDAPEQSCTILQPIRERHTTLLPSNLRPLPCSGRRCRHCWPTIPLPGKMRGLEI